MKKMAIRVTTGEMELLGMLWKEGSLTIGDAHKAFDAYGKAVSYPTMQTRLNRMADKGLLSRSEDRPTRYRAAVSRDQVTLGHLRELISKISRGDIVPLVAQLLSHETLTETQLTELQRMLTQAKNQAKEESEKRRKA